MAKEKKKRATVVVNGEKVSAVVEPEQDTPLTALGKSKVSVRKVVKDSNSHDPSTVPSGIMAGKKPKFGKKNFGE